MHIPVVLFPMMKLPRIVGEVPPPQQTPPPLLDVAAPLVIVNPSSTAPRPSPRLNVTTLPLPSPSMTVTSGPPLLRTTACSKVWIFLNSRRQPTRKSRQTVPELHT